MNYPVINHQYHHVIASVPAPPGSSISYSPTISGPAVPYTHVSYPSSSKPTSPYHHQLKHPLSPPISSSAFYANGHINPYLSHVSPSPLRIHLPVQKANYPAALPSNIHQIHSQFIVQQAKHLPLIQVIQPKKEINVIPAQVALKFQPKKKPSTYDHEYHYTNNGDEISQQIKKQRNNQDITIMPTLQKFSVSDSENDFYTHPSDIVTPISSEHHDKCIGDSKSVVTTTASSSSSIIPDYEDDNDHDEREFGDEDDEEPSVSHPRIGYGETVLSHKLNKRKRECKESKNLCEGVLTNVLKKVCNNCIKLKKKCKKEAGSDQCETCEKKGLPCHFARQKKRGRVFGTIITTRIKRAPNEPLPASATYDPDYLAGLQLKLGNCIQLLQQISEGESIDDQQ